MEFNHQSLNLTKDKPLVFTAMSKHLFYFRMRISSFVLEQGGVPLNPFMIFDYFLNERVDRDLVREGNNNIVKRSDEIWVFGSVSNGVLAEVQIAKQMEKPIRYFKIEKSHAFVEIERDQVEMEEGVQQFANQL